MIVNPKLNDLYKSHKETKNIINKINRRERQILVHSYLYYELNENLIQDYQYDNIAKDLASLIKKYPDNFKKSVYYEIFKGFGQDGCYSGYNIPHNQPEIINNAFRILRYEQYIKKEVNNK